MLPKKQITLAALVIMAGRIVRAYEPEYEGYFTPYIPSEGGDSGEEQPTMTEEDKAPTPTGESPVENTDIEDQPSEPTTVPTNTRTSSKPSNTPDGKRYTPVTEILSDGSSYQKGSFNSSLKWQSTGILQHGGCPVNAMIGDCYSMYLDSEGMLEPMEDKSTTRRKSRRQHPRQLIPPSMEDYEDPYHPSLGVDSPHHYFKSLAAVNVGRGGAMDNPDATKWKAMASGGNSPCKAKGAAKNNEPPAPRQRLEFLSWPPAPAGETWVYSWRTYIDERTSTTSKWWHMMQLLQRSGCGGYVTAQTASKNTVAIKDKNRNCPNGNCDTYDYSLYKGRTLSHHIRVRYGEDGIFSYLVKDLTNGKTVLEYNAVGDMGSSSSIKFGIYRQAVEGMSEARAYVGDYVAEKVVA